MSEGCPLIYLDSAATSLKPETVVRAVADYLAIYPANVHRGLHTLSERATEAFEGAREKVARFLGTDDSGQIIFTRGTTESINLVAQSWGTDFLKSGDEIVLSDLEHHSNLVPWQMVARERGATLRFAELTGDLSADRGRGRRGDERPHAADRRDRDVQRHRHRASPGRDHRAGPITRGPGAGRRGAEHSPPPVRTQPGSGPISWPSPATRCAVRPGIGVLYARRELLEAMPPVMSGGSMVTRVTRERAEWNEIPWKFEAGTPPIAEAIGLGAAIDYLDAVLPRRAGRP